MSKRKRSSHKIPASPGRARGNGRAGRSARLADPVWADEDIAPPARPATARRRAQKPRQRASTQAPRSSPQMMAAGADSVGELLCVAGPEEGLRLPLTEGVFGVGRGRDNHFVLKDIAASRQHIEIRVQQGEVSVHDLGSGNGTRVNGRRVQKAALHSGDRVEIGNSTLTFQRSQVSMPSEVSEVSVVPPRPAPRSSDVWPETETLLSEIAEFERVNGRPQARSVEPYRPPPRTSRQAPSRQAPPRQVSPSRSAPPPAEPLDPGQSLSEIRQAIGAQGRFGSVGWLLGAALLLVLLIGVAAMFFFTSLKASKLDQAQALVVQANQAMLMGRLDQAQELFEQASGLDPESVTIQQGRELLTRTRQSAQAYQRASELLDRADYEGARHALEGVLPDTPRYKDVADQQRRIDEAEARALLTKARQALAQKALDSALQLVEKARVLAPDLDEARSLREQIEQIKSQPLTPVQQVTPAPRPTPKPVVHRPVKRHRPKRVRRRRRPQPRRASISEGEAKGYYREAVGAYRSGDRDRARSLLKKIIRGRKRGDLWYEKAQSFVARKL